MRPTKSMGFTGKQIEDSRKRWAGTLSYPISTDKFFWDKKERDFCQEASSLGIAVGFFHHGVILMSQWTGKSINFPFFKRIMDDSGEDVGGWVYKNPETGLTCTIFND